MKLLITEPTNNIIFGLYKAAEKQHDIVVLKAGVSIYQVLDSVKVDYFICETQQLTQSIISALNEYNIPTIVFGLGIDFPQKQLTVLLSEINPIILKNHNGAIYYLKPAAHCATWEETPSFDILYVAENTDDLPHLHKIVKEVTDKDYTLKIVGPVPLPFIEYVGNATYDEIIGLITVSKITILTTPTYVYDVAYRKKFAITTFKNEFFTASLDELTHYMMEEKHRNSAAKKANKIISDKDIYIARFNEIMEKVSCK